jgi:hypothetical protein
LGRGKSARTLELIDAAVEILAAIQPATVRAVCYQLFIRHLIESMAKTCTNRVSTQLVWARGHGALDWEWIVDETREPEYAHTWQDPDQLITATVRQYRKDRWQDQPRRVEVWSEKGTVRGTLRPVLDEYGVTFRVMHGYGSATALHQAAQQSRHDRAPWLVLYVGDWDPSGLNMSEVDLPARLAAFQANIEVERIALDSADVTSGGLPGFSADTKQADSRYQWFVEHHGDDCWELDALSPALLRERAETAIKQTIYWPAWELAAKVEALEQESMRDVLGAWRSRLGA